MDLWGFFTSTQGLIVASTALVSSVTLLVRVIRAGRKRQPKRQTRRKRRVVVFVSVLAAGLTAFFVWTSGPADDARNVQLTNAAWEALNARDSVEAAQCAGECVGMFQKDADREQRLLEAEGAPLPPTGPVADPERTVLLNRGLLNDVAVCLYLQGLALENQDLHDRACDAYRGAMRYTYARAWDDEYGFWSPADKAADRLASLQAA